MLNVEIYCLYNVRSCQVLYVLNDAVVVSAAGNPVQHTENLFNHDRCRKLGPPIQRESEKRQRGNMRQGFLSNPFLDQTYHRLPSAVAVAPHWLVLFFFL